MNITKPRGTNDFFGKEISLFNFIVSNLKRIAEQFNFQEIMTPIFESKELFQRNIGDTSNIVTKEFYDFIDKGNRAMVLRPEGTVAVVRSVVENKMLALSNLPLKFFYVGPMFRYERPQNGRNRQFYQFGVEKINCNSIYDQLEVLLLGINILSFFQINNYELRINYIGNFDSRKKWINELKKYFQKYIDKLTPDSVSRVNKNPLRILDDKVDSKKEFVVNAPKIDIFLSDIEKQEIQFIKDSLDRLKINYVFDSSIVRGLDYYFGIVFEFVSTEKDLSKTTIIGGGKYCNLIKELGGLDKECIGFAIGIERLMKAYELENVFNFTKDIDIYFISLGDTKINGLAIVNDLRKNNYVVEMFFNVEKIDKHFKYAEKLNPKLILIYGETEQKNQQIIIKEQKNKSEIIVNINELINKINELLTKG